MPSRWFWRHLLDAARHCIADDNPLNQIIKRHHNPTFFNVASSHPTSAELLKEKRLIKKALCRPRPLLHPHWRSVGAPYTQPSPGILHASLLRNASSSGGGSGPVEEVKSFLCVFAKRSFYLVCFFPPPTRTHSAGWDRQESFKTSLRPSCKVGDTRLHVSQRQAVGQIVRILRRWGSHR